MTRPPQPNPTFFLAPFPSSFAAAAASSSLAARRAARRSAQRCFAPPRALPTWPFTPRANPLRRSRDSRGWRKEARGALCETYGPLAGSALRWKGREQGALAVAEATRSAAARRGMVVVFIIAVGGDAAAAVLMLT